MEGSTATKETAMVDCPVCRGLGTKRYGRQVSKCPFCNGDKVVSEADAREYRRINGDMHETPRNIVYTATL